jgi:hypothetical protein
MPMMHRSLDSFSLRLLHPNRAVIEHILGWRADGGQDKKEDNSSNPT